MRYWQSVLILQQNVFFSSSSNYGWALSFSIIFLQKFTYLNQEKYKTILYTST